MWGWGVWQGVWGKAVQGSVGGRLSSDGSEALGESTGSQGTPAPGDGGSIPPAIKLGHSKRQTLIGPSNLMLHFEFVVLSKLFSSQLRSWCDLCILRMIGINDQKQSAHLSC